MALACLASNCSAERSIATRIRSRLTFEVPTAAWRLFGGSLRIGRSPPRDHGGFGLGVVAIKKRRVCKVLLPQAFHRGARSFNPLSSPGRVCSWYLVQERNFLRQACAFDPHTALRVISAHLRKSRMCSFVHDQTGSMEPIVRYRSTRAEFAHTGRPIVCCCYLPRKGIDQYSSQICSKSREPPRVVLRNARNGEPDMPFACGHFLGVDKPKVRPQAKVVLLGSHERQQPHQREIESDANESKETLKPAKHSTEPSGRGHTKRYKGYVA